MVPAACPDVIPEVLSDTRCTIKRLETKPGAVIAQPNTVAAIRAALDAAGVVFLEPSGLGPGVRLKGRQE
jgi:hypothetical protein